MLEKNKVYRARIQGYTSEGLGVARIDGQAVFVHQALRGEDCDVLILKVLKNAAFGKVVQVHEPSPHRREPDCPYYGRCGGCDFRHMDRAEELAAKRQRVQDALARIGGSAVTVEGIDGGEPLHYRNKSQYPVSADGQVGFYKARGMRMLSPRVMQQSSRFFFRCSWLSGTPVARLSSWTVNSSASTRSSRMR